MDVYLETTKWDTPNHTYVLTQKRTRLVGYISALDGQVHKLKNPIRFDTKYRSFTQIKGKEAQQILKHFEE